MLSQGNQRKNHLGRTRRTGKSATSVLCRSHGTGKVWHQFGYDCSTFCPLPAPYQKPLINVNDIDSQSCWGSICQGDFNRRAVSTNAPRILEHIHEKWIDFNSNLLIFAFASSKDTEHASKVNYLSRVRSLVHVKSMGIKASSFSVRAHFTCLALINPPPMRTWNAEVWKKASIA